MPNKHTALIYTMVLVSASDRKMTDNELRLIGDFVQRLPVFEDYDATQLPATAAECAEVLAGKDGLEAALDSIVGNLPDSLRETAYALAVEIAITDLKVNPEELRLLQLVRERIGVDRLAAAAVERSARARYARG